MMHVRAREMLSANNGARSVLLNSTITRKIRGLESPPIMKAKANDLKFKRPWVIPTRAGSRVASKTKTIETATDERASSLKTLKTTGNNKIHPKDKPTIKVVTLPRIKAKKSAESRSSRRSDCATEFAIKGCVRLPTVVTTETRAVMPMYEAKVLAGRALPANIEVA
jgi:hypothetical protein